MATEAEESDGQVPSYSLAEVEQPWKEELLRELKNRRHAKTSTTEAPTWADKLLSQFKSIDPPAPPMHKHLRVATDGLGLHRHSTKPSESEDVAESAPESRPADSSTSESESSPLSKWALKASTAMRKKHGIEADLGRSMADDPHQFHKVHEETGKSVDTSYYMDKTDEELSKLRHTADDEEGEEDNDIEDAIIEDADDADDADADSTDDAGDDNEVHIIKTTTTTTPRKQPNLQHEDDEVTQKFKELEDLRRKVNKESNKAHPKAPAHIKNATKQHMMDEGVLSVVPVAFHSENGCGERIPARKIGLSLSQHTAHIWQSPSFLQAAEHPGRDSFSKPGSGGTQVLKDEGMSQPGIINGEFPFVKVLKDGYYEVGCFKDAMYINGDKFGDNKDQYKMESSGVSIAVYKELVLKESQVPMTPRACFEFCRTVPDMVFFGITNGRDCYCTPYYKPMAGNADTCDSGCEGDPAVMCGNQEKSTIWEMHLCDDTADELANALTEAKEALDFFFEQAGLSMDLGRLMQAGGAALEIVGQESKTPTVADNAMEIKKGAKDLEQTFERGLKFYKKLLYVYQDGKTLTDGDFSTAQHASAAELATHQMKEFAGPVLVEAQRMFDLVKLAHPPVFKLLKEEPEPTDYAAVAVIKDGGFTDMYQHASYASDNTFPPGLSTCSGPIIGGPLTGISVEECGKVCTATEYPDKCVAFSYYTMKPEGFERPVDVCVLLSDVTTLTTYENGDAPEGCIPKAGKAPAEVCTPSALCMIKGSEIAGGFKAKKWDKSRSTFGTPKVHSGGYREYEVPDEDSDVIRDFTANFDDRTTTTTTTTTFTTTTKMISSMGNCRNYETQLNDQGCCHGESIYLDRHNVECAAGTLMSGWKLNRGGTSDKFKIQYTCCDMRGDVLGECSEESTALAKGKTGNA